MVRQVKPGFIDAQDFDSVEARFILITELPQERAGNYKMHFDPDNLLYRVTNRVQSNPGCPQADFGNQTTSFQLQPLEENNFEASTEVESDISIDENTSTAERSVRPRASIRR